MVILALDTSAAAGSAAIARDGTVVVERASDPSRTHGERLPRELMALLDDVRLSLHDIDRFAVSTGPGSFTGLRVGIATIQGLAFAQRKSVVPVSSFEALAVIDAAATPAPADLTAVWIDAHRGEVFGALYRGDGRTMIETPTSLSPAATLEAWARSVAGAASIRFTGDGSIKYQDIIRTQLGDIARLPDAVPAIAGAIATIASSDGSRAVSPHAVVPLYVRRPDAELARDRRQPVR